MPRPVSAGRASYLAVLHLVLEYNQVVEEAVKMVQETTFFMGYTDFEHEVGIKEVQRIIMACGGEMRPPVFTVLQVANAQTSIHKYLTETNNPLVQYVTNKK